MGSATSTRRSDDPYLSAIGLSENGDGGIKMWYGRITSSNKFNRVAQLAFVVVNLALRGAHVLVPRQRLYHAHINALVRQFGQKLPSAAV